MGDGGATADSTPPRRDTQLARAALGLAGLALAYGVARLVAHAAWALRYPFGLDYGEGVVWQQMHGIVAGRGYGPLTLLPAFVYQYPPLYHLVTHAAAALTATDELLAGRWVSLLSALTSGVLVGRLAMLAIAGEEAPRVRRAAGVLAGLVFATLPVVLDWSLLMRVDMLACALTLAGMLFAGSAVRRPGMAIAAGLMFCAALFTRQTCLPAPAAAFLVVWLARPRAAWLMAGTAVAAGLAGLAVFGGQRFLLHIVGYNMNRVVWDHGWLLLMVLLTSAATLALGAAGSIAAVARLRADGWGTMRGRLAADPRLAALAIVVLTLLLKTLMLPAILKSGASDNYLIDWFAPVAALVGVAAAPAIRLAAGRLASRAQPLLLMLIGLGIPVQMLDPPLLPPGRPAADAMAKRALVERIRASAKPVVAEEDQVLLLRAGKPIVWEPAIVAELGSAGLYDERALAGRVRRGDFGFFVTGGHRGDTLYDQRFRPALRDAIDAAYPRRERIGGYVLHLPR